MKVGLRIAHSWHKPRPALERGTRKTNRITIHRGKANCFSPLGINFLNDDFHIQFVPSRAEPRTAWSVPERLHSAGQFRQSNKSEPFVPDGSLLSHSETEPSLALRARQASVPARAASKRAKGQAGNVAVAARPGVRSGNKAGGQVRQCDNREPSHVDKVPFWRIAGPAPTFSTFLPRCLRRRLLCRPAGAQLPAAQLQTPRDLINSRGTTPCGRRLRLIAGLQDFFPYLAAI